jgi:hypothetical protein
MRRFQRHLPSMQRSFDWMRVHLGVSRLILQLACILNENGRFILLHKLLLSQY